MRKLTTILLLFVTFIASATDYYVKTEGNDGLSGTSDANAWATITKVNTEWAAGTFAPGDNIYFNRGDTFYGSIVVTESGASGSPITIGAYGTGDDPVIYGFTTLTSWTDEGGGIYSKAVTPESAINMVLINGVEYAMGREPESSEGYNTYETCNTNISITDADSLNSAVTDWTGAEAVIRKNDYLLERCSITLHSGSTLTYTDLGVAGSYSGTQTFGYFIQNDLRTLDTFGEWYFNDDTLYIYFGSANPVDYTIKASTIDNLVYIAGYDYINVEDIEFEGANVSAINLTGTSGNYVTYCNLDNCEISYSGNDGCYLTYVSYTTLDSLTISHSARAGIYGFNGTECDITYCNVSYSGMIIGRALTGSYGVGIRNNYLTNTTIQYNNISYSGSDGIYFQGDNTEIRNNLINYSSMVVSDRGGIYTGGSSNTGRIIDGNIILNTYGNNTGAFPWRRYGRGIYLDAFGSGVTVTNNTVAYSADHGICNNGGHSNIVRNNLVYDNPGGAFYMQDIGTNPYDLIVASNQFICKNAGTYSFIAWASNTVTLAAFATLDSNYYVKPLDNNDLVYLYTSGGLTLVEWQALSSFDAHTQVTPKELTNTSQIYFYYNASSSAIVQQLPVPMIGIDGTEYDDMIVTIPAWRGIVLFEGDPVIPGETVFATSDSTKTKYMITEDGKYLIIQN